jgi:diguanylate cyclase
MEHVSQSPAANWRDATGFLVAGDGGGEPEAHLAQTLRLQRSVALFYLIDTLFLLAYAACGVVDYTAVLTFGALAMALCGFAEVGLRRRLDREWGEANFVAVQVLGACGLLLATAALAPAVGILLLMTLLGVVSVSALRLPTRYVVTGVPVLAFGASAVIYCFRTLLTFPAATLAEIALTSAWVVLLLFKGSLINLIGAELNRSVDEANARLSVALKAMVDLAHRDDVTGSPNRRSVMAAVEQCVGPFAVALLDIDHFKKINDQFGHAAGDAVLRRIAELMAGALRPNDVMGRYGGEEFLLLLRDVRALEDAVAVAERARARIADHNWQAEQAGLCVTASAGVALSWDGARPAQVVNRADDALYKAKRNGRNQVCSA